MKNDQRQHLKCRYIWPSLKTWRARLVCVCECVCAHSYHHHCRVIGTKSFASCAEVPHQKIREHLFFFWCFIPSVLTSPQSGPTRRELSREAAVINCYWPECKAEGGQQTTKRVQLQRVRGIIVSAVFSLLLLYSILCWFRTTAQSFLWQLLAPVSKTQETSFNQV